MLPDYVMLHRCVGGCRFSPDISHCVVTKQDKITVKILEVTHLQTKPVVMYNHTGCECDCINRPSDCDHEKHWWDRSTCSCQCITHSNHCASYKQTWNQQECECRCTHAPIDCGRNKEWDSIKCGCHSTSIKV